MNVHVLALAVAAAATATFPASASAEDRAYKYDGRRHGGPGRHGVYDIGYTNGYDEGAEAGRRDARRGRRFDFHDESRYRKATHRYRRSYGPRHLYSGAFRSGFAAGYRDAYRAYARYDRYDRRGRAYERLHKGDPRYDGYHDDIYDWRSDGRHRHRSRSGWCHARH